MKNEGLADILSERNLALHGSYLEDWRLKFSVLAKSGYDIMGKSPREIFRMRSLGLAREEILRASLEVYYHELYFSSFSKSGTRPASLGTCYSSVGGFLYEAECLAMSKEGGFLLVFEEPRGALLLHSSDYPRLVRGEPRLAVDLSEHAYFLDYAFDKRAYLRAALSRLDLSRMDKI